MDQAFLNARAQASHWQDDSLESEMPKSGGSSPPISAWLLLSIPQPTYLCISDSRLRPKEHMVRTKTQTLLANSLAFSCPNLVFSHILPLPVAGGPKFKSIPVSSQTSQVFPTFGFQCCIWPYLPESQLCPGTGCTHTLFSFAI